MLDETKECIEKKDAIRASEKLYKASEESLELLFAKFGLLEYEDAKKRGRWTTSLLFSTVRKLSEEVNPDIVNWWDHAWFPFECLQDFRWGRNHVAGDKIKKNWQYCAFGVICGYRHANFWYNRDDYGLKRRVTVTKLLQCHLR